MTPCRTDYTRWSRNIDCILDGRQDHSKHSPAVTGAADVVRTMPNTTAAVGRGVSVCYAPQNSVSQRARVDNSIGIVEWVEREELHRCCYGGIRLRTGLCVLSCRALTIAGVRAGLPPSLSARIARATVEGADELMFREQNIEPIVFAKMSPLLAGRRLQRSTC
jgi:pyrroline-5-carboxylate reductase